MVTVPTSEGTPLELLEPAARGGMGVVWRARYTGHSTPLAVKVLTRLSEQPELRSTFLTEVRAQAELRHPGVAQIYGFGEMLETVQPAEGETLRAGTPYLALEWTDFGTLRELDGPHRWTTLKQMLLQVLDALAFAHARDVVHCDLKPSNILLFEEENGQRRFKLTDFGVAHALERSGPRVTGDVAHPDAGTPTYMAPEQLEAEWRTFGGWTDLYALGCIAFEIAGGQPPYEADNVVEIATGHLDKPVPELDARFPVPDGFQEWLEAMMARDFQDRFRWAAGAATALERLEDPAISPDPEPASEDSGTRETQRRESTDLWVDRAETSDGDRTESSTLAGRRTLPEGLGDLDSDAPTYEGHGRSHAFDPPPMPPDWRRPAAMRPDPPPQISKRLFELREVPFVGRTEEREIIWEALEEVVDRGTARGVVVEGPSGSGRSRLARWMGRRAGELGQATFLEANFEPGGSPERELPRIVQSWFRTWGLDRDAGTEIIRDKLQAIAPEETPEAAIDRLVAWLSESVFGDDDLHREMYDDRESRIAFHMRILQTVQLRDPLFILLDDVQWAEDTLSFARRFLESANATPVLFVATYEPESAGAPDERPPTLDALRDADPVRPLELDPLPEPAQLEMVRRLAPALAEQLDEIEQEGAVYPGSFVDRIRSALES